MLVQQICFTQVDGEEKHTYGGILVDNEYIICGCCGTVFPKDEWEDNCIEGYKPLCWIDISEEIKGD